MVEQREIINSLSSLNGMYFSIPDLNNYAKKIKEHGKSIEYRMAKSRELLSYILYYDNYSDIFISMVWTAPEHRRKGIATNLLKQLIQSTRKDITLEVHKDNHAVKIYKDMGFEFAEQSGITCKMCLRRRIAIMQPYVFPFIGYFQLIQASDLFVFYDDVNYITRGWVNRNRILLNGKNFVFTIPVSKASRNKLINEISLAVDDSWRKKFNRTLIQSYRNAPFFSEVAPLIMSVFDDINGTISDLAINSIAAVLNYLDVPFNYTKSSICSPETKGIGRADRLIEIATDQGYKRYVNSPGGKALYSKEYFEAKGIKLGFVESESVQYKQYLNSFVQGLSIIDVLMFNEKSIVKNFMQRYKVTR